MREGLIAAERWARRCGYGRVAGTDEAGRGALAGPLVAAAVILPAAEDIEGLEEVCDSKLLTPAARKRLFKKITETAEAWSFACISAAEIDGNGLQRMNIAAMRQAVLSLRPPPDMVIVDYYRIDGLGLPQLSLVRGDRVCRSVAAASILAKVIRDSLMWQWSIRYPEYGFESNKGYGTEHHLKVLAACGPAPCHRSSFRGVLQMELVLDGEDGEE